MAPTPRNTFKRRLSLRSNDKKVSKKRKLSDSSSDRKENNYLHKLIDYNIRKQTLRSAKKRGSILTSGSVIEVGEKISYFYT